MAKNTSDEHTIKYIGLPAGDPVDHCKHRRLLLSVEKPARTDNDNNSHCQNHEVN